MPESLGRTLKKVRESKHLSTEEVSERTRIPRNIISAIEDDKLAEIKSHFYAKSFVKTYSSFLGALAEPVIKEFLSAGQVIPKKPETTPRLRSGQGEQKPAANEIPKTSFPDLLKYKKQIITIVAAILVFWVLSSLISHAGRFIKDISTKKPKTVKSVQVHKDVSTKSKEKKEEQPVIKTDIVELEVSALDNTWLQVIGDGELLFTGLFKKGNKDVWKAKKEIKFEVGNAGGIKINVNGKAIGSPGKKGEKKEIIITKDGIK